MQHPYQLIPAYMKIEIEKSGEGYVMVVNETRNFVFESVDKLMERLGEVLLEEADNARIPF